MKLMKKIALQIHSRIDAVADSFENREAIADAYIREYEQLTAKAKVKQKQISAQIAHLEKEITTNRQQMDLWAERAREIHPIDEDKALECIARRKKIEMENAHLSRKLSDTKSTHEQLSNDLEVIFTKLDNLKLKRQSLSSRQLCADTLNKVHYNNGNLDQEVDDLFNRWETDIVANELNNQPSFIERDELAEEFKAKETIKDLKAELDNILNDTSVKQESKQ